MDKKLNIAFVWHMHQPLYKDPLTGEYAMPWVLLHGTKDYYDMVAILDEFPDVHQTFNIVPCLVEQINDYCEGRAKDVYRKVAAKHVSKLTKEDKIFILQFFFQANWDHMIKPVARYQELLRKRGMPSSDGELHAALRYFNDQDYLDIQVLFNLVWIDPYIRERDPFLTALYNKGGGYTEEEKHKLLDKQIEIMRTIIPKYAEMRDKGIVELTATPYFHPIMPLLCDSFAAKEAMPNATLPKERFQHPEDAREHLTRGLELHKKTFGEKPLGLWPSEGSVSMDILPLLKEEGVKWFATDEEILSNSLKRPIRRDGMGNCFDSFLYRPYALDVDGTKISAVFRDHVLSDLIGFEYARMDPQAAADDFVGRLLRIHSMVDDPEKHIVSIILDGENAWETYRNDGWDFLRALYSRLSNNSKLRCVTVSEFLTGRQDRESLPWIFPGSWINHNFKVWIGHHEDNAAWDYIAEARAALVKFQELVETTPELSDKKDVLKEAWDELYAAEGSDWFWWYGEEHSTMLDEYFDSLFRKHIKKIYQLIGLEPPVQLELPITSGAEKVYRPKEEPQAYINPVIDGDLSNYFEWLSAGRIERVFFGSAMHREIQGNGLIEGISYGFSKDKLFFRFDYLKELAGYEGEWNFSINFIHPKPVRVEASVKGKACSASVFERSEKKGWIETGSAEMASDAVVELAMPLELLGLEKGEEARLYFSIDGGDKGTERWPIKGYIVLTIPPEDFESQNWFV